MAGPGPAGREADLPLGDGAVGLRLIIAYKIGKAIVQASLAVALPILIQVGITTRLVARIAKFAEHVVHGWTAVLARHLAAWLTPNHLVLISVALGIDAVVSAFEAWALHRRFRWAAWLVVIAGGTLVPFEVVELVRRPRVGRAIILGVNLAIIAYLARRARAEHAARVQQLRERGAAPTPDADLVAERRLEDAGPR
jgi:uncharacterized membrane protein (DUF2068 family)